MTERLHPNYKDGIVAYRHCRNLWMYHCYKFNNINTLPSCSGSLHCQNNLSTYRVLKNNLNYLMCFSYGIIEGLTRISRISRILFRCITPSIALSLFLVSHRFHRFAQILLLQATIVTMPCSNRYFSACELLIGVTEHELHELHE